MKPKQTINDGDSPRVLHIGTGDAPEGAAQISFEALDADCLHDINPELLIFPLFAAGWDAALVLIRLKSLGYHGTCLVLAPNLPRPKMVEQELRAICPNMQIKVITSGSGAATTGH
jgi:hypothetical protein